MTAITAPTAPAPQTSDAERLAALARYDILDTPPEPGFDDIVMLAAQMCDTPVALVSLLAADRQWFKARVGLDACETPLNHSVCVHALGQRDLLVIPDLARDERTRSSPLVTGAPFLRFYAGARLETPDGVALGTLCVVDKQPRPEGLTPVQADGLRALARQVMTQLALRQALIQRDRALAAQSRAQQRMQADAARCAALIRAQQTAAASAGGMEANLRAVLQDTLAAVPRADGAAFVAGEGEGIVYSAAIGSVAEQLGTRRAHEQTLAGLCMRAAQPLFSSDLVGDTRVDFGTAVPVRGRSVIAVPVLRRGEVVGALELCSRLPGIFTDDDILTVRLFAGAISGASFIA
ncbi:GAF domain-containing protein [Methylobacterium crusticola]|nr:GAF domain-containing protein [Methylobacterium crusticola]